MKLTTLYEDVGSCTWCGSDLNDKEAAIYHLCRECFYKQKEQAKDRVEPGPEPPPSTKLAARWSQRARLPVDNAPAGLNTSTPT